MVAGFKTLIVYESYWSNTKQVAEAIAQGIGPEARVAEVGIVDYALVQGIDLLVVGGPTHIHGMSGVRSRRAAIDGAGERAPSRGIGVREWVAGLPRSDHARAAAFDTRLNRARWLTGSAALGIQKGLRRKGYRLAVKAESFIVADGKGPLLDGEIARATEWGRALATHTQAARQAA